MGRGVGESRQHVPAVGLQPDGDVQQVPLAVGAADELPLPGGREYLAKPVLGVDRAVVCHRDVAAQERVGVAGLDRQARSRPAQVHQPQVTDVTVREFVVGRLVNRPQRRLLGMHLPAFVPGHAPAIPVELRQSGELTQAVLAEHPGE